MQSIVAPFSTLVVIVMTSTSMASPFPQGANASLAANFSSDATNNTLTLANNVVNNSLNSAASPCASANATAGNGTSFRSTQRGSLHGSKRQPQFFGANVTTDAMTNSSALANDTANSSFSLASNLVGQALNSNNGTLGANATTSGSRGATRGSLRGSKREPQGANFTAGVMANSSVFANDTANSIFNLASNITGQALHSTNNSTAGVNATNTTTTGPRGTLRESFRGSKREPQGANFTAGVMTNSSAFANDTANSSFNLASDLAGQALNSTTNGTASTNATTGTTTGPRGTLRGSFRGSKRAPQFVGGDLSANFSTGIMNNTAAFANGTAKNSFNLASNTTAQALNSTSNVGAAAKVAVGSDTGGYSERIVLDFCGSN